MTEREFVLEGRWAWDSGWTRLCALNAPPEADADLWAVACLRGIPLEFLADFAGSSTHSRPRLRVVEITRRVLREAEAV